MKWAFGKPCGRGARWATPPCRLLRRAGGVLVWAACTGALLASPVQGWLDWRGPERTGYSRETGLPDQVSLGSPSLIWSADFSGKSTPVIAGSRLYILGFRGEGPDLQEALGCFDAETGQKLWEHLFNDFLSDTIYQRYATASPAIDPDTGNVYMQGSQGMLAAFTREGQSMWQKDMMELFGRLTFPNGRTASPVIDRELVITRGITANWGTQGPGGDRFYAFDKSTGDLVWSSTPGDRPKDNSFSHPYLCWLDGRRVLFSATGDGSVVCLNARTGDPLWRIPLFKAGINATVLVHKLNKVIAVFGTPYELGHMVGLRLPHVAPPKPGAGPLVLPVGPLELWRNDISSSTSSPILVGDRAYIVAEKGELCSVDVETGKILWKLKLGIEERNSCPLFADGKLYVPILDDPQSDQPSSAESGTRGGFYIVKPADSGGEILCHVAVEGRCFGTPVAYNGKVYLQTAKKLYCFGRKGPNPGLPPPPAAEPWPAAGTATQLQVIPSEVLLRPGGKVSFRVRSLDADGLVVQERLDPAQLKWSHYIPPTAKVRAKMAADFDADGQLIAPPTAQASAGAFQVQAGDLKGYFRGRLLPRPPFKEDFESFTLSETTTNDIEPPTAFAYPPLPWIGARVKFEVRERDGTKALTKTIDNRFFQRAFVFIGAPEAKNYTIEADVMSDGNRRKMSDVGVINQRYLIELKGNEQKLEINSNQELFRFTTPFKWTPNIWYRLKARVQVASDGSGAILAKAWKRSDPEPEAWTLQATHHHANLNGSPGLFGFSPQDMRVYLDNIAVTPN